MMPTYVNKGLREREIDEEQVGVMLFCYCGRNEKQSEIVFSSDRGMTGKNEYTHIRDYTRDNNYIDVL